MQFDVQVTPNAREDLRSLRAYEQRIIADGIRQYLTIDAQQETGKRKLLGPNPIAPWELRIDAYRVFYSVQDTTVYILSIGYKVHNDLYIRGKKVTL